MATKTNTPMAPMATKAAAASTIIMLIATPMLLFQGAFAAPTLHGPITCQIVGANQLECKLNVSGLGGATTATATLVATATVTTGCINQGAAETQPQGLQRTTTTVTDTQTVNVEKGGRATFDLVTSALNAKELRTCPDGMTPTVVCVTFSNISIAVIPNSGPSKTFSVPGTLSNC
ncbi:MAG: hypothetical protein M3247_09355 [Thermoproteota archaeon]|nr:hypothetical protein [Thermoproteota archaeon]